MAFPLLLIPLAALAGYGAKKVHDGYNHNREAELITADTEYIISMAENNLEYARTDANREVKQFAEAKIRILSREITDFVNEFKKIKNVDFRKENVGMELYNFTPYSAELVDMEKSANVARQIISGGVNGLAGGTLMSIGAYGGVMYGGFAVASTGTAIGSLSGAAATKATLAWLGGGSLASGGAGIAGGMTVLGGAVLAPVMAIAGYSYNKHAENRLYNALENNDEAIRFQKEVNRSVEILMELGNRSSRLRNSIENMARQLPNLVNQMRFSGRHFYYDYSKYDSYAKKNVCLATMLAKIIKIIIDVKLLDESGNMTAKSEQLVNKINALGYMGNDVNKLKQLAAVR